MDTVANAFSPGGGLAGPRTVLSAEVSVRPVAGEGVR